MTALDGMEIARQLVANEPHLTDAIATALTDARTAGAQAERERVRKLRDDILGMAKEGLNSYPREAASRAPTS